MTLSNFQEIEEYLFSKGWTLRSSFVGARFYTDPEDTGTETARHTYREAYDLQKKREEDPLRVDGRLPTEDEAALRCVIIHHLKCLGEALRGFEQTTHGHIGGGSLDLISRDLENLWAKPDGFRTSNLSQSIAKFLKKIGVPQDRV